MSAHILIADRDPRIRYECCRFLCSRGYSADVAANEAQCLEQIHRQTPSVLVLDADLLWNDSNGLLEWLRTQSLPEQMVVLLTGGHSVPPLPPHLQSLVAGRLDRPQSLPEIQRLIDQLQELIADEHVCHVPSDPLSVVRVYQ